MNSVRPSEAAFEIDQVLSGFDVQKGPRPTTSGFDVCVEHDLLSRIVVQDKINVDKNGGLQWVRQVEKKTYRTPQHPVKPYFQYAS